jgi:diacylglycerol kinase family enzyme
MARRVLIVFNPIAGRRRGRLFARTLEALKDRDCVVEVRVTQGPGDAEIFTRDAVATGLYDVVVAAGGDGTINEVIQGLTCYGPSAPGGKPGDAPAENGLYVGPAFATLPFGTVNVLALDIGLKKRAEAMAETIAGGREVAATVGIAGDRTFLITAGVGLDSAAVKYLKPWLKRLFGWGAYIISMITALIRDGGVVFEAEIDGERVTGSTIVVINVSRFGGPHVVSPETRIDDGVLTVLVALGLGRRNLMRYGLAFGLGRVPQVPDKILRPAREVKILSPVGYPVQIDGDCYGVVPVTFSLAPAALKLLVPPS